MFEQFEGRVGEVRDQEIFEEHDEPVEAEHTVSDCNDPHSRVTLARILGYIPLGGIYDNKHAQRTITQYGEHRETADVGDVTIPSGVDLPTLPEPGDRGELAFDGPEDVAEYIADDVARSLAEQIEFDTASQQPFHVELWCEKGLPDYIHALCEDLQVNVIVEGDLSLTIAHEFVQRVNNAGKPAIICYLSDFDPKGDNMSSAMAGKVAWLNQRGDLDHRVCIEQVAVTKEQVDQFGLPRKPISESDKTGTGGKAYDTLVDEWEQRKGTGACELNTLEQIPDLYKHIVREASPLSRRGSPRTEPARARWLGRRGTRNAGRVADRRRRARRRRRTRGLAGRVERLSVGPRPRVRAATGHAKTGCVC
ncbi:hypothetical protein [Haloarcula sp. JP-L23]|uniref:hypothetical protein n=1 Tax=Haloarcula sp. JP-L23 TaxID=2716717 RepID=UPI00140EC421|nr:hypothetical protein G9465_21250 [Haloarcula sp. JP-L23]